MDNKSLVFIDSRVSDYQSSRDDLSEPVEMFVLNGESDELTRMAGYLKGRSDIDAVHVISHGSHGALYLDSTVPHSGYLDAEGVDAFQQCQCARVDGWCSDLQMQCGEGGVGLKFIKPRQEQPPKPGCMETLIADTGYRSEKKVAVCEQTKMVPLIAVKCKDHHTRWRERFTGPSPLTVNATSIEGDDTPVDNAWNVKRIGVLHSNAGRGRKLRKYRPKSRRQIGVARFFSSYEAGRSLPPCFRHATRTSI
jgi:hypothetical protein